MISIDGVHHARARQARRNRRLLGQEIASLVVEEALAQRERREERQCREREIRAAKRAAE